MIRKFRASLPAVLLAPVGMAVVLVATAPTLASAQIGGLVRGAVHREIDKKIDNAVSCAFNDSDCIKKAQADGKPVVVTDANGKKVSSADSAKAMAGASGDPATAGSGGAAAPASYKSYQNYDFVPGDRIVFEDDFRSDDDGEFPAHWKLLHGQGVINKMGGDPVFALTEGNYVKVTPRITTDKYLSDTFTVEFDFYPKSGGYGAVRLFLEHGADDADVNFGNEVTASGFGNDFSARYPGGDEEFKDRWHHAALVFKGGQLKAYEDQYRVLVVPDAGNVKPESVQFGGIGDPTSPILFKNVRIANGGSMKMIDQLTKDGRIVTHGITFDVNKSVVKPQSMGTIRQIVAMLQSDASLKLEIDGHTDSDGDASRNLALSQSRADAVKQVLVDQGIDAARLSTKGFGATKPIASNDTPEGKANNRRVELVKN